MNAEATSGHRLARERWQRLSAASVRAFHVYANWLVGISWRRFVLLSVALLIVMGVVHDLPPFTWTITERVATVRRPPAPPALPRAPKAPKALPAPDAKTPPDASDPDDSLHIEIDKNGIRISPQSAASAAQAAGSAAERAAAAASAAESAASKGLRITLPPGLVGEAAREFVADLKRDVEQAVREARDDAKQAAADAVQARRDAEEALAE